MECDEIKPCPRCGEKVDIYIEFVPYRSMSEIAAIRCSNCGKTEAAAAWRHELAKKKAIAVWNMSGETAAASTDSQTSG